MSQNFNSYSNRKSIRRHSSDEKPYSNFNSYSNTSNDIYDFSENEKHRFIPDCSCRKKSKNSKS